MRYLLIDLQLKIQSSPCKRIHAIDGVLSAILININTVIKKHFLISKMCERNINISANVSKLCRDMLE